MCDTVLAPPDSSSERAMLFAKNSDRRRNEAQVVEYFPATTCEPGTEVRCTYISIPQVARTNAVLLCRPFWIWGAEMGANEYGVAIGNEALQARSASPQEPALLGMDLVRLALERAHTAAEAVEVITTLLERHGQGGNCGHLEPPSFYQNGFMVADPREAFVVETIDRHWLVERVVGVRAISNRYSVGAGVERVSVGLQALLAERGWSMAAHPDYGAVIADPAREHIGNAGARRARSTALLTARDGSLDVLVMMRILRDHGHGPGWTRDCTIQRTLCMHAGADERPGQTVGSMISQLTSHGTVHWVTATAAPCISIFKPVMLDVPVPPHGPRATGNFDADVLWWQHERLHRAALLGDFGGFVDRIDTQRDALEAEFVSRMRAVNTAGTRERAAAITDCWQRAIAAETEWSMHLTNATESPDAYMSAWEHMNRLARFELYHGG